MMERREFLALPLAAPALAQTRQPNVVIILADDLGSADLGCDGGEIETPNIDRLAGQSVRFGQFYACSVCSPTRSALMTGRSPMRLGVTYTVIRPWSNYAVPLTEHFLPQSFQAAGYQTAITGKWHLGHARRAFLPNSRGFDHAYGHVNGAIDYYTHMRDGGLDWNRNGRSVREEGYSTDLLAEEASRWIRSRDASRPFLLYLPFNAPHAPLQAPRDLEDKYAKISDVRRRRFAAMVDAMDAATGRLLKTLDEERVSDNTIVLFFSDNGGPVNQGARNNPLRAGKATVYEGGIRVPAMLRWPEGLKVKGRTNQVMTAMDVFPTLAAAAGVTPKNKLALDGRNLWEEIGRGKEREREDLFWAFATERGEQYAARRGQWKLVVAGGSKELYDLANDPVESVNLAPKQQSLVNELTAKIEAWKKLHPPDGVRPGPQPASYKAPAQWVEAARAD